MGRSSSSIYRTGKLRTCDHTDSLLTMRSTPAPPDGYMYMDGEQPYTMNIGHKMIDIWEHKYGFIPGQEQITSRSRRRFRLSGKNPNDVASSLWLLFYSRTGEETRVQANPMQARPQPIRKYPLPSVNTKPFNLFQAVTGAAQVPNHQQQMQQQYQMQQLQQIQAQQAQAAIQAQQHNAQRPLPGQQQGRPTYVSPAPPTPNAQAYAAQLPPAQKRAYAPQTAAQLPPEVVARMQRGEVLADTAIQFEESMGDEFDAIHPVDIARARFVKHQEWMEELFSAYPASRIEPPSLLPPDVTEDSLKKRLDQHEQEIEQLKAAHEQRISKIKHPDGIQGRVQLALQQLSAQDNFDLDALTAIENQVGLKTAEWNGNVRQGPIEAQ